MLIPSANPRQLAFVLALAMPLSAGAHLIDFEQPPLGILLSQVLDPYIDAVSGIMFTAITDPNPPFPPTIGLARNSYTSACVPPSDADQKLGSGTIDGGDRSIGLAGFPIRADFPSELVAGTMVAVETQSLSDVTMRLRLYDAFDNELGSLSQVATPGTGRCGSGLARTRMTLALTAPAGVAYAVVDCEVGNSVFVIDQFEATPATLPVTLHRGTVPALSLGWRALALPLTASNDDETPPFPVATTAPGQERDELPSSAVLVLYRLLGPGGSPLGNTLTAIKQGTAVELTH